MGDGLATNEVENVLFCFLKILMSAPTFVSAQAARMVRALQGLTGKNR